MRRWSGLVVVGVGLWLAAPAAADVKVSDQAYVRNDGGTDQTIDSCSVNNFLQNEPATSVAPHDQRLMTAGANDYCTNLTIGDSWAGFYYSADGGQTWTDSLLPGYPTDTSAEGQASPLYQLVTRAADPAQAWDNAGHLYYAGVAANVNVGGKQNASLWLARYDWASGPKPDYRYTTLVARGTPSPAEKGLGHDKVALEVDRGADSPHAGNVYLCWARFTASGTNNGVYFASSTDQGRTFAETKISESVHTSQFCDVTVTRDGSVYVGWRQFRFNSQRGQQGDAVAWAKSTDGGRTFSKPEVATEFVAWDPVDRSASSSGLTENCGDGFFACQSGYVFSRVSTQVRIAADPTSAGDADDVFVVYDASVPNSLTSTGTSYGTVASGTGSQAAVYLLRTSDGGTTWSEPQRIDPQAKGHQFFPDIAADSGRLNAVWQDSRADTASGPGGGDFRTVPISNRWVTANPPGGVSTGTGVDTFYATSTDSGASWSVNQVSAQSTMPQYEQLFNADLPFFGDYNYIAAAGTTALMAWTDQRDTTPGIDPKYAEDGMDGFDVHQCRTQNSDGSWGPDTCPTTGGRDENVYGAVVP
jgi:hypothetical protein